MDTMIKNVNCGVKYKYDTYFLEYTNFNDDLTEYKCLCCNKHYQQKFDEKLKEQFFNGYKFSNHDKNKFILLLGKRFTLMNIWMIRKKSVKHHYLKKKIFTVIQIWKMLLMQIMRTQKEFEKILKQKL